MSSSDCATGILFSKMIEVYAIEQYGANWGVETEREAENL